MRPANHPAPTVPCTVCEEDHPLCQAVRIPPGTREPHVLVCRDCHAQGIADGILDPLTGDFAN